MAGRLMPGGGNWSSGAAKLTATFCTESSARRSAASVASRSWSTASVITGRGCHGICQRVRERVSGLVELQDPAARLALLRELLGHRRHDDAVSAHKFLLPFLAVVLSDDLVRR